jgi:hypothetical protein
MTDHDWETTTKHLFGLFRGLEGDGRDEQWARLPGDDRAALVAGVRRSVAGNRSPDAAPSPPRADADLREFDGCRVIAGGIHKDEHGRERRYARISCNGLEAVADGDTLEDAAAAARALLPRWGRQPTGHHLIRWRGRTVVLTPEIDGGCVATATGRAGSLRIARSTTPAMRAHKIMSWLRSW